MTTELNLHPKPLRLLAQLQVSWALLLIVGLLPRVGFDVFAANGLAVMTAHDVPQASFWRWFGFVLPGIWTAATAIWLWVRATQPLMRMACVLFAVAGMAHGLQALYPLHLDFLIHPDNEKAALLNTLWWISASIATVLAALALKPRRMQLTVLAVAAVVLALVQIAEILPPQYAAISGWLQLAVFVLAVEQSVRLT